LHSFSSVQIEQVLGGFRNWKFTFLANKCRGAAFKSRVARFFSTQNTKAGENIPEYNINYLMTIKHTKYL
jgi:hypothetical protein